MSNTASLKKEYQDRIVPALTKEFGYKSVMQVPYDVPCPEIHPYPVIRE